MTGWAQGAADIEALLAKRHLERVTGARAAGAPWLKKASQRLDTAAAILDHDPESAFILAYDAARFVGEALLAQQGLRPTQAGGSRSRQRGCQRGCPRPVRRTVHRAELVASAPQRTGVSELPRRTDRPRRSHRRDRHRARTTRCGRETPRTPRHLLVIELSRFELIA